MASRFQNAIKGILYDRSVFLSFGNSNSSVWKRTTFVGFVTFHTKSHNMKALVTLSHS